MFKNERQYRKTIERVSAERRPDPFKQRSINPSRQSPVQRNNTKKPKTTENQRQTENARIAPGGMPGGCEASAKCGTSAWANGLTLPSII